MAETKISCGGFFLDNETLIEEDGILKVNGTINNDIKYSITEEYDSTSTYNQGEYCWYDDELYRCKTTISTPEPFTVSHWDLAELATDVTNIKDGVTAEVDAWLGDNIAQETGYALDRTLSMSNAAAPADLVGDVDEKIENSIASDFDATQSYSVGDIVYYNNSLYRFISNHTGAWNADHVEEVEQLPVAIDSLSSSVSELKSQLDDEDSKIANIQSMDFDLVKGLSFETGEINLTTGVNAWSDLMIRTGYIDTTGLNSVHFSVDNGYKYLVALINEAKNSVVNSPEWFNISAVISLSDYPTAKYMRILFQKMDNTKPASLSNLHASYESDFTGFCESTLKSGEVTYNTLAPDLKSALVAKYNDSPETISYTNTNSLLRRNGALLSYTGPYAVSDNIDCSSWYSMKFSGSQYYDGQCLAFYDVNGTFISCFPDSVSGVHNYTLETITIPANAKYIKVAQYNSTPTYVYILEKYVPAENSYKWKGKKWCCIGDSLTEVNGTALKKYHDYISDCTGITVVNLGVSGTGYMNGGTGSNPFRNRVSSIPIDADVITIFGSFNDLGETRPLGTESDTGTSTIGGCINTTLDDIFARITLANVGIITPTPWGSAYPLDNESSDQYKYVQLLKDICERRGIPCLDLFHCSQLRPWDSDFKDVAYSNDPTGVHPDENGHKLIAPRFEGFLDTLLLV